MTKARRAYPLTKRQRLGLFIAGLGIPMLVLGAIFSDVVTRSVDTFTSRFLPAPAPEVRADPYPFSAHKGLIAVVIPGTPQEIGEPPRAKQGNIVSGTEILTWADPLGGVDAGITTVRFSVTSKDTILVEDFTVRVVERKPTLVGSYVYAQGGGDLWRRAYDINLDDESLPIGRKGGEDGYWDFPISLGPSDTYVADVIATAREWDVSWEIDVHYVFEGEAHTATFDDAGQPFRTTGVESVSHHWVWSKGWLEGPP